MNKEAPIGADFDRQLERVGSNWCLLIHSVFLRALSYQEGIKRDIVRSRSAPIGADFDITESLITVKMKRHQLVPILI